MVVNGVGAACTAVVMVIFAVTSSDGAWIILLLVPSVVFFFFQIHFHYKRLARACRSTIMAAAGQLPPPLRGRARSRRAPRHAGGAGLCPLAVLDVTAVHISIDSAAAERVRAKWGIGATARGW